MSEAGGEAQDIDLELVGDGAGAYRGGEGGEGGEAMPAAVPVPEGAPDCTVLRGDCLDILPRLATGSFDAVITDPPYSSGGMFRGDRMATTDAKYTQTECQGRRPDFVGDNRDQRSWLCWCNLWLTECLRLVKPSGYILCFTDWRQLPTLTDALQVGGWVWRGIIAWDKTEGSRAPHTGYFRHQCEYIVWATNGVTRTSGHGGPWPGCFRFGVKQSDKHHQTGKPTPLLRELVKCVPPGGLVLDPFAGSGTTGVAAIAEGRRAVMVEKGDDYAKIAEERVEEARQAIAAGRPISYGTTAEARAAGARIGGKPRKPKPPGGPGKGRKAAA